MPDSPAKHQAKCRFMLRICMLYAHPNGRIPDLARLLNINENTLKTQIQADRILPTKKTKAKIEKVLGPEFLPPEYSESMDRGI